jgi:hypothetical protein
MRLVIKEVARDIGDVFPTLPPSQHRELVNNYMRTAFFLPDFLLKDEDWTIAKIETHRGRDLLVRIAHLRNEYHVVSFQSEIPMDFLVHARSVSLSIRTKKGTSDTFIVAKAWFGPGK